jgi:hypothetical protein
MKQFEIDKLVDDIQGYLNQVEAQGGNVNAVEEPPAELSDEGLFIPTKSRKKMNRFLRFSKYACFTVEALTIGLLTTAMLAPFGSWSRTIMFVTGSLLLSIFAITVLLGMQTRIRLLMQIESNTQRIAVSKARIAEALARIRPE